VDPEPEDRSRLRFLEAGKLVQVALEHLAHPLRPGPALVQRLVLDLAARVPVSADDEPAAVERRSGLAGQVRPPRLVLRLFPRELDDLRTDGVLDLR